MEVRQAQEQSWALRLLYLNVVLSDVETELLLALFWFHITPDYRKETLDTASRVFFMDTVEETDRLSFIKKNRKCPALLKSHPRQTFGTV